MIGVTVLVFLHSTSVKAPAGVQLRLDDLGGDESLEQAPGKRRLGQFGGRIDAQQMTREAGIGDVHLRRLDQALAEILVERRHDQHLCRGLENPQPLRDGRDADAERGGEQAAKLAHLRGEQISNIGSQDMNDEVWLQLARRINELVAMPDVGGIVITHGTDTIEETGYFLNLSVKSRKPVVLTASMRPSTALSADGPLNFFNAVAVAADQEAVERGVLVVINDWIHGARSLTKTSTTAVQTFMSPLQGINGTVAYGATEYYRLPVGKHTTQSEFSLEGVTSLPGVDIIMATRTWTACCSTPRPPPARGAWWWPGSATAI